MADAFDFPIGGPDGRGYRIIEEYEKLGQVYAGEYHAGVDWQHEAGGPATVRNPVVAVETVR